MGARLTADALVVLHVCFVFFVVLGGFLVIKRPKLMWLHVPAALWGAGIEFLGGVCPLTTLEIALRHAAGEQGYAGGFVEHYMVPILYPPGLTRLTQYVLGFAVLAINGVAYLLVMRSVRRRRGNPTS